MTTAVAYGQKAIESFNGFNPNIIKPEGRVVATNYRFDAAAAVYLAMGQGRVIKSVKAEELIAQARSLRRRHFWRFWGLRAPDKRVIEAAVEVIQCCPSEFLLEGYKVENYGNGTLVMTKRSPHYMITINIGKTALSYAKLNVTDHKVVTSGKCEIAGDSVAELFKIL